MEYNSYNIYIVAIPIDASEIQNDFYDFATSHKEITPPIYGMNCELQESETIVEIIKTMFKSVGGQCNGV